MPQDDEDDVAWAVSHGFEGGVFGEAHGDILGEDHVDDGGADEEREDRTHLEDDSDGGFVEPAIVFERGDFLSGEDADGVDGIGVTCAHPGFDVLEGLIGIGTGFEVDETHAGLVADIDIGSHSEADIAEEDCAIGGETGADFEATDDTDATAAEFGFATDIFVGEVSSFDRSVVFAGGAIDEDKIGAGEEGVEGFEFGDVEAMAIRGDGHHADRAERTIFGATPFVEHDPKGFNAIDGGMFVEGIEPTSVDRAGFVEVEILGGLDDDIKVEFSVDDRGGIGDRAAKAELDKYEEEGESHTGDGDDRAGRIGDQVEQCQRCAAVPEHRLKVSLGIGRRLEVGRRGKLVRYPRGQF